jgi:hypothetical protein
MSTENRRWDQYPLRIGALQCNFEGGERQTLAMPARWARMGMNVEQLFHPMADSYSSLFNPRRHGKLLRRYIVEAKRRGLRIILYLNIHIIGPGDSHRYRTWAQQSADGEYPKFYETYYACCLNSLWKDHFFNVLDSLCSYDIDGIFLDGPATIENGCHCRFCQNLYRKRYGKKMPAGPLPFDFCRGIQENFLSETYRRFKQMKPDGIVYMNLGLEHAAASYHDIRESLKFNDWLGTEGGFMFYGSPKNSYLWKPGFAARLLEAVAPQKPRVIFMAGDQKPWSWYMHAAAETELCIASSVANGANVWYGLHGASRLLETPSGKAAGRMFNFLKKHSVHYEQTISAAKVALFFSYETDRAFSAPTETSDLYGTGKDLKKEEIGDHKKEAHGFADWLTRRHIPYDIVTDLNPDAGLWQRYDWLILPGVAAMSPETAEAVRNYVRAGKNLLATFNSSRYDQHGRRYRDLALGDVFGVIDMGSTTQYRNFNYFIPGGRQSLFRGITAPYVPAAGKAIDIRLNRGAIPLARYLHPWAGRYMPNTRIWHPAIVENRFGNGSCLYFAGNIGEFWLDFYAPEYDIMLYNAVRAELHDLVRLVEAPSPVEMTVRQRNSTLYVHLVNHCSFDIRPISRIVSRNNLVLQIFLPYSVCVRSLALHKELPVERHGGIQKVILPVLKAYDMLQIQKQ